MKKTLFLHSTFAKLILLFVVSMYFCTTASAASVTGIMDEFSNAANGWSVGFQIDDNGGNGEDYVATDGQVGPGYGGQTFDAEYLFWKRDGNRLSVGLQTGFNTNGPVTVAGITYYSGDIALSFDLNPTPWNTGAGVVNADAYEFAVDSGLYTEDMNGDAVGGTIPGSGIHTAGLYSIVDPATDWNNNVLPGFEGSDPFAMTTGNLLETLSSSSTDTTSNNYWATETLASGETSFARVVSFDLANLGIGINNSSVDFTFFAHWTMSCGNDEINGYASIPGNLGGPSPVPEPATVLLLGIGLAGLGGGYFRRRIKRDKSKVQK